MWWRIALQASWTAERAHWTDEYRFQRADGSYIVVTDRGYVVRDARGRAVRMVGALQDITERKLAEQEARGGPSSSSSSSASSAMICATR